MASKALDEPAKADDNPWYLLSTLFGQPTFPARSGDDELQVRNRTAWNRYMAAELGEDRRAQLIKEGQHSVQELTPFAPEEMDGLAKLFFERHRRAASTASSAIPNLKHSMIDFSTVKFDEPLMVEGFCFPIRTTFRGAIFSYGANFKGAKYLGYAIFTGATFSSADFTGATFSELANFTGATFFAADFGSTTFFDDANFTEATLTGARFKGTTFSDWVYFERATLGEAYFDGATFLKRTKFSGVTFSRRAHFQGVTLPSAEFEGATFASDADFGSTTFTNAANFRSATFSGRADFRDAKFSAGDFEGATFSEWAYFEAVKFSAGARFARATFSETAYFKGATFSAADFKNVTFSNNANFEGAKFAGEALFDRATFSGSADFKTVVFSESFGNASFAAVKFRGSADFDATTFLKKACFACAEFESSASFVNAEMKGPTSFEGAAFITEPPRFFGTRLHEGTVWRVRKWPGSPQNADAAGRFVDAYERLKLEMDRLRKHQDELDFFARELESRRILSGDWRPVSELKFFRRIIHIGRLEIPAKTITPRRQNLFGLCFTLPPFTIRARIIELRRPTVGLSIALYGLLCDYGRSYTRPIKLLIVTVVAGTLPFWAYCGVSKFGWAVGLSLANTFAVLGIRKELLAPSVIESLPGALKVIAAVQTGIGIVLLFLFGLAVRNFFRMK